MKLEKKQDGHRSRVYRFSVLTFVILYSLYCFVFAPLNIYFSNDIIYMNTALPGVFELLYNLSEIVAISVAYATVIYSLYRFGLGGSRKYFAIFAIATLSKYTANMLITWVTEKFSLSLLLEDVGSILLFSLLECVQFVLVVLVAHKLISTLKKKHEVASTAAADLGQYYPEQDSFVYPFKKIIELKNPLLCSALVGGAFISATKVISRLIYDVFYTYMYGAPSSAGEVLEIVLYYLTDVATGVLAYFVIVYILIRSFNMYIKDAALSD